VGNFRLFELPGNGVMQISDGGPYLSTFFEPGKEIVGYDTVDGLIESIEYYLAHPSERLEIARAGYRAAMERHGFKTRMLELVKLVRPNVEAVC
jgi:spore maturation protein CgeB